MKASRPLTPEQAYSRIADRCAVAEYCTHEVRERLRRYGVTSAVADTIVDRLVAERYVDDRRYALAYVRQKSEFSRWGRRKIAAALAAKRISRDIAAEALDSIDPENEHTALCALLAAKARSAGSEALTTYEGRTRLFRFAASRGYTTDAIARAIRALMDSHP